MKRYLALLLLTFVSIAGFGQNGNLFCNAGFRPDGFIDFSGLPHAPNFPNGGVPVSAPMTVTLPVIGVPGLTAQVTIPALQALSGGGPVYTVVEGTLVLGGNPASGGPGGLLILQFSSPVTGVGIVANNVGRGSSYTLETDAPGNLPANFQTSANNFTLSPNFFSIPLEEVDLDGGFSTASVTTGGSTIGFGTPSLSDLRVQSSGAAASYTSMVPKEGLQQWLSGESAGGIPFAGGASVWPDQSGNGHDATQTVAANQPGRVQGDGNACQGAFSFSGNQYFNFDLPIDGWNEMTIFLVAKSSVNPPNGSGTSMASAIFWNENASWGNTFVSPYQTSVPFRFGTEQVGNQPVYQRPLTVGQDFTISRAEHNGSTDSLYVNSLLAFRQGNKQPVLAGTTGTAFLGRGLNNTYFHGEISEVLVYNRVLSADEAASVESYLKNKFATR